MITNSMVELLTEVVRKQIVLAIDPENPGRLRYRPKAAMTGDMAERLIRHKPALLRLLWPVELPADVNDWPVDWQQEYDERAAIMEFDGNMTRLDAETWAETIVRAAYSLNCKETGKGPNDITKKW